MHSNRFETGVLTNFGGRVRVQCTENISQFSILHCGPHITRLHTSFSFFENQIENVARDNRIDSVRMAIIRIYRPHKFVLSILYFNSSLTLSYHTTPRESN